MVLREDVDKAIAYVYDLLDSGAYQLTTFCGFRFCPVRTDLQNILDCLEAYVKDIKLMDRIHNIVAAKEGQPWDSHEFEVFYGHLWRELSKGDSFAQALCTVLDTYYKERPQMIQLGDKQIVIHYKELDKDDS